MTKYKIMNILLSDAKQFVGNSNLLVRGDAPFHRNQANDGWVLSKGGSFDFMTFFNALSIEKWSKYTNAKGYGLHLELKGSAATISQTWADSFSWYSALIPGSDFSFKGAEDWVSLDIPISAYPGSVIQSFVIKCNDDLEVRDSYYYACVEEDDIRDIELALCTTTFKKESYITNNIQLVRDCILNSSDSISKHFRMHVVDNGRTLDVDKLSGAGVFIHPNDNAGGAGGFARGMIEAMRQEPKATHVLLMDDDVLISPESIVRTFNLLSLLKDSYAEAFISGAMMNLDEPNIRWEDMGFMGRDGLCHALKPVARMDVLHDIVDNEAFDIPSYMPRCDDQEQQYGAWWYCAIPVSVIDKKGLPLPIFVRYDDVEYGLRCKPQFITMNGICIWHLHFYMRYNAAQECYQTTRNSLINRYATGMAPKSDFLGQIDKAFRRELSRFNYKNAALILQGLEDFLKGPDWIMQPVAQKAFMDSNKASEKLVSFNQLVNEAKLIGYDLSGVTSWKIWRDLPAGRFSERLILNTCNGQRGIGCHTVAGKVAILDIAGNAFLPGELKGAEFVIGIDIPNRRGVIRKKDIKTFNSLWSRYENDLKKLKSENSALQESYSSAAKVMTSISFWEKYLNL